MNVYNNAELDAYVILTCLWWSNVLTSAGLGNRYIHCYILIGPVHQNDIIHLDFISIIPPLPDIANLSMKYFILSKVYTDKVI